MALHCPIKAVCLFVCLLCLHAACSAEDYPKRVEERLKEIDLLLKLRRLNDLLDRENEVSTELEAELPDRSSLNEDPISSRTQTRMITLCSLCQRIYSTAHRSRRTTTLKLLQICNIPSVRSQCTNT